MTIGSSAAGSLRLALRTLGRRERVLSLTDDLSFGPINPPDPRHRMRWCAEELGFDDDPEVSSYIDEFWATVTTLPADTELVAWMSRRSVMEYCGFLELISRVETLSVIDIADIELVGQDGATRPDLSQHFGVVHDEQIVSNHLIERASRVSAEARATYRLEWQRVREENAALRVLTPEGLMSAELDHFDNLILSCITSDWQSCGHVLVASMAKLCDGAFHQLSADQVLFARLLQLIDDEVIEGKNDQELWSLRESWVRLHPLG